MTSARATWNEADYAVQASAGSVDPQWTWYFNAPSTWLASVLVLRPAATQLAFTVQPSTTLPFMTIQPAVQAVALDASGNPTGFNGPVTIAIATNGGLLMAGTLSGTRTVNAVNGVVTDGNGVHDVVILGGAGAKAILGTGANDLVDVGVSILGTNEAAGSALLGRRVGDAVCLGREGLPRPGTERARSTPSGTHRPALERSPVVVGANWSIPLCTREGFACQSYRKVRMTY